MSTRGIWSKTRPRLSIPVQTGNITIRQRDLLRECLSQPDRICRAEAGVRFRPICLLVEIFVFRARPR